MEDEYFGISRYFQKDNMLDYFEKFNEIILERNRILEKSILDHESEIWIYKPDFFEEGFGNISLKFRVLRK